MAAARDHGPSQRPAAAAPERPGEGEGDRLRVRVALQLSERQSGDGARRIGWQDVPRPERQLSELVCESLIDSEKDARNSNNSNGNNNGNSSSSMLGGQLFDTYWKVKDTMRSIQNDMGRACATVACVENLLNWTHPWKTAVFLGATLLLALVFGSIPGRWLVLLAGLTEFGAVFVEDSPPSHHVRNVVWNLVCSLPTDQELIDVYSRDRDAYLQGRAASKRAAEQELQRLRLQALWVGPLHVKGDGDRSGHLSRSTCSHGNSQELVSGARGEARALFEKGTVPKAKPRRLTLALRLS